MRFLDFMGLTYLIDKLFGRKRQSGITSHRRANNPALYFDHDDEVEDLRYDLDNIYNDEEEDFLDDLDDY